MNYPPTIQKLIKLFAQFPTVGPRTAARFVFYLLKTKKEDIDELNLSIAALKKNIKTCSLCFNAFEPPSAKTAEDKSSGVLCEICTNPSRDQSLLCVVEKETDLAAIEKTKKYKGLYFIFGRMASAFRKKDVKNLKGKELQKRIKDDPKIKEIIIATNPNAEGEATALYLERLLKPLARGELAEPIKITRLGRGLPVGGELEYADEETLKEAFAGRK